MEEVVGFGDNLACGVKVVLFNGSYTVSVESKANSGDRVG
jgi:hypothetical protein